MYVPTIQTNSECVLTQTATAVSRFDHDGISVDQSQGGQP